MTTFDHIYSLLIILSGAAGHISNFLIDDLVKIDAFMIKKHLNRAFCNPVK